MKKSIFFICVMFLIFAGCTSVKTSSLSKYSSQISFFENTAEYYSGDGIMKCKLSDTATLNDYKCISWIYFFNDGQIKQLETAVDIKRPDFVIPSHSIVFFNDQNHSQIKCIWFSKDVTINKIECKGGGKTTTDFYDNDKLKACFLAKDQVIQGVDCKSSLFKPVFFSEDGKIKK